MSTLPIPAIGKSDDRITEDIRRALLALYRNQSDATTSSVAAAVAELGGRAWSATASYVVGDIVSRTGVAYICILANTNQAPPNATYWIAIGSGASASGYVTRFDLDFSAQTGASYATNGTYSIGGFTFTLGNRGNIASASLINGSGLSMTANSTPTEFGYQGFRSAGLFSLPLLTADPSFGVLDGLMAWTRLTLTAADANYEEGSINIENGQAGSTVHQSFCHRKGWPTAVGWQYIAHVPGSDPANLFPDTANTSDDVMVIEQPRLASGMCRIWTGAWSSGWPAVNALRLRRTIMVDTAGSWVPNMTPVNALITLANHTGNLGAGNHTTLFGALRVDTVRGPVY